MTIRVIIYDCNGTDVSDEVDWSKGKSNPFGWWQKELWHRGEKIEWIDCGTVVIISDHHTYERVEEDD